MPLKKTDEQSQPVERYLARHPKAVRVKLEALREAIITAAPSATEGISYGMPSYKLDGNPLIYFAAYKNHIGLYATPEGHQKFSRELGKYKHGKGSVQFPLDQPVPFDLIKKIVRYKYRTIRSMTFTGSKKHQ